MSTRSNSIVDEEILATGEATRHYPAVSDAAHTWAREASLSAMRSSDGRHRIPRTDLAKYIEPDSSGGAEVRWTVPKIGARSEPSDQLGSPSDREVGKIRSVGGEYRCCMEIAESRPDHVVVDCPIESDRCLALAANLSEDGRAPSVRLIPEEKPRLFPADREKTANALDRCSYFMNEQTESKANLRLDSRGMPVQTSNPSNSIGR